VVIDDTDIKAGAVDTDVGGVDTDVGSVEADVFDTDDVTLTDPFTGVVISNIDVTVVSDGEGVVGIDGIAAVETDAGTNSKVVVIVDETEEVTGVDIHVGDEAATADGGLPPVVTLFVKTTSYCCQVVSS
jgi:hypothetical protein